MVWAHLRHAFRAFGREPGFALFAVLTLALGIGASTAMFSVFNGVLLSPVPFADPARVVSLNTKFTAEGRQISRVTGGDWMDLAAARDTFDAVASYSGGEIGIQLRNRAEWAGTYFVSPDFFRVFDAAPIAGRPLTGADAEKSAVVSAAFARRAFGSVERAKGQVLRIDTRPYEVAGVMPDGFAYPPKAEVWVADKAEPDNRNRTSYNYQAVARLKPGVTVAAASARVESLGAQLAKAFPENKLKTFTAVPVRDNIVRNVRSTVVFLMAAVVLVLLISCTNVAHLLLARAAGRTREFAVRSAMGASGGRMVAQMVAESLALGIAAGIAGIALAYAGVRAVVALAPENLPRINEVHVDWRVLLFAVGVSILSSLLFGLAPAWQVLRNDIQAGLRAASGRGVVGATKRTSSKRAGGMRDRSFLHAGARRRAAGPVLYRAELGQARLSHRRHPCGLRARTRERRRQAAGDHPVLRPDPQRTAPPARSALGIGGDGAAGRTVRVER